MNRFLSFFKHAKKRKFPLVESLPFYKENGIWYAELSYCHDHLSDLLIGEDVLLDKLARISVSGRIGSFDSVAMIFAINEDWPYGHFIRLDLQENANESPCYVASGELVEALEMDGYRFPFFETAKILFKDCPKSLFVYELI